MTIPPFTFEATPARYDVSSCSVGFCGIDNPNTVPATTPFVDGVHGATSNLRLAFTGEVMKPLARSGSHPGWFQFQGSRWAFFIPQLVIVLTAHLPAPSRFGEPVGRGPYTSVKKCSIHITFECSVPSVRILAFISASTLS